MIAVCTE